MSVTRIVVYRVEVNIPDDVWCAFGQREREYSQMVLEATDGSLAAGCDSYSDVYEWAEFANEKQARECEQKLLEMVEYFQNKLKSEELNQEK
jgi:hypothetical protein